MFSWEHSKNPEHKKFGVIINKKEFLISSLEYCIDPDQPLAIPWPYAIINDQKITPKAQIMFSIKNTHLNFIIIFTNAEFSYEGTEWLALYMP